MSQPLATRHPPLDVVCIGGINWDRKLKALSALLQGSSNPCTAVESAGGVARNVAENLARLGLSVGLLGQLGRDASAQALLSNLQALGVNTSACLQAESGSTGSYTALLDQQGQLVIGMADMALTDALGPELLAAGLVSRDAKLWMADLNLPSDSLAWLARQAHQHQIPLVVLAVSEPKMQRLPDDLRGIALLVCNRGELASLCNLSPTDDASTDGLQRAFSALSERGLRQLLVTQGARGAWCLSAQSCIHVAAPTLPDSHLVDETGAGDAFCAGVCAGMLRYPAQELPDHAQRAMRLAALTVQCALTVSPDITPDLI